MFLLEQLRMGKSRKRQFCIPPRFLAS